jgi:hypothetical protein
MINTKNTDTESFNAEYIFCYYVTDMFGSLWWVRPVNMGTVNVLETIQSYANN